MNATSHRMADKRSALFKVAPRQLWGALATQEKLSDAHGSLVSVWWHAYHLAVCQFVSQMKLMMPKISSHKTVR
jgi:hypothetical protein